MTQADPSSRPSADPALDLPQPPGANTGKREWAVYLAKLGRLTGAFKVFPCRPDDGATDHLGPMCKRPRFKDWQRNASWDAKTVDADWTNFPDSNIGLAIQPGFAALDLDIYKPGKEELLKQFEAEHGELPNTLEFRTANGGYHLIFSTEKVLGNGTGRLPGFCDVRGFGGYVVGPGSTYEGRPYTVDQLQLPVPLPAHVDVLLMEKRERAHDVDERLIEEDLPPSVERGIAYLQSDKCQPAIQGQGGDAMTLKTAAMLRSYGLSEGTALELMLDIYNARCEPAWDSEGMATKVRNAYRYATSAFGNMTAAYQQAKVRAMFTPVEPTAPLEDGAADTARLECYKALHQQFTEALAASGTRDLRGKMFDVEIDDTEPPWIIDSWVAENTVTALAGDSGSFKTYQAIDMLLCKATGRPWAAREGFAGYDVGEAAPVVMFAGEGGRGVLRRVHAAAKGHGLAVSALKKNLLIVDTVYALNRPDGLAGMVMEIEAHNIRPKIIAVDTLNLALDGNEDSADEIKKAISGCRAVAERYSAAVILVDHFGNSDKTRQRGSSAKKANQDGLILVTRAGDTVKLQQAKNRDADTVEGVVAFKSRTIELFTSKKTGKPVTDLCFDAVPPGANAASASLFKDQSYAVFDRRAVEILDSYVGTDIKATDLARMAVAREMPELIQEEVKFAETCKRYRQHLVSEKSLAPYVASRTTGGEASTFYNPKQNGVSGHDWKRRNRNKEAFSVDTPAEGSA